MTRHWLDKDPIITLLLQKDHSDSFLCRLWSIATHRDHFVRSPSVCLSVCHTSHVTLSKAMFGRRHMHSSECCHYFYAPGLKGPPGASSVWIVCPSVCPSVRNSVPLINKVQYLKFGWSYSNQTWNVSSSKDCSHFTDITCPFGWGRVKM